MEETMRKLFVLFLFLSSFILFSQDSEELTRLQEQKDSIVIQIERINSNPDEIVQEKINELNEVIKKLPDRQPTNPENLTMKQYLIKIRDEIQTDTQKYIEKEKEKLTIQLDRVNSTMKNKLEGVNEKIK